MHHVINRPLPEVFCWTRFGTEAGEAVERIIQRKERDRLANAGVFFWGIGNPIGTAISELLAASTRPEVLFSPMLGGPREVDSNPEQVVAWTVGETPTGRLIELPEAIRVTSHGERRVHYALVCASDEPLKLADLGRLQLQSLRNLRSGKPVGASQVTAVVRDLGTEGIGQYLVAMRAWLVPPFFLRLREPVTIAT